MNKIFKMEKTQYTYNLTVDCWFKRLYLMKNFQIISYSIELQNPLIILSSVTFKDEIRVTYLKLQPFSSGFNLFVSY